MASPSRWAKESPGIDRRAASRGAAAIREGVAAPTMAGRTRGYARPDPLA